MLLVYGTDVSIYICYSLLFQFQDGKRLGEGGVTEVIGGEEMLDGMFGLSAADAADLQGFFAKKIVKRKPAGGGGGGGGAAAKPGAGAGDAPPQKELLEGARTMNVGIGMKKLLLHFKPNLTVVELATAVATGDLAILPRLRTEVLMNVLPNDEEQTAAKKWRVEMDERKRRGQPEEQVRNDRRSSLAALSRLQHRRLHPPSVLTPPSLLMICRLSSLAC
jgi:hypothetical protein